MLLQEHYHYIKELQNILKRRKGGVYLIGGFLRDHLLERENQDFDFAVEANALKLAKTFSEKIKGAYILLDEEHGCARVAKKNKGKLMTFDFADYRAETIEEDLKHRDFTINTLALDIRKLDKIEKLDGLIEDHRRAIKDIKAGRIKRVSINAIREDPLRMMRAFSLKALLNFRIDLSTLNQIKKEKHLLRDVSYERIRDELFKVLEAGCAFKVLKQMNTVGILTEVIPQIRVMLNCTQGGYHHLDVWPHSLESVNQIDKILGNLNFIGLENVNELKDYLNEDLGGGRSRKAVMRLGCLLHDIGKPDTRKKEGDRYSFHGHEHAGARIVTEISKMLKISTRERHALEDMVRWHLRPGYLSNFKKPTDRAIFRYFRDLGDEAVSVLLLSLADQRSTRGPLTSDEDQKHHQEICTTLIRKYFDKKKEKPVVRLINGDDLIKKFKLKPSPLFKKILLEVEEQQALGKIGTRKEAVALAKSLALKDKK